MTRYNFDDLRKYSNFLSAEETSLIKEPSDTLRLDRWLSASLLQKAIRRGHIELALQAASSLMRIDRNSLWRRLSVTAWEDISFGDLQACYIVTAMYCTPELRVIAGGEWQAAAACIARLCRASKNRFCDDLLTIIIHDRDAHECIEQLASLNTPKLRSIAYPRDRCMVRRTIASWLLIGSVRFPLPCLPPRRGDLASYFDGLSFENAASELIEIGQEACRATGTIFPAMVALLWDEWTENAASVVIAHDQMEDGGRIRGVPEYAFDGHTALGSRYLTKLISLDAELTHWLFEHFAPEQHLAAAKELQFKTLSALCDRRQTWAQIEYIRERADQSLLRLPAAAVNEGRCLFAEAKRRFPIGEVMR